MSLSNTAVPKYYGRFRDAVIKGEIPVNYEVSLEMNRIDALIESPMYYYDDKAVEGWVAFCNNELTLPDGRDLYLLDTFKLWAEQVYGWYYFVEKSVYDPRKNGGKGGYVRKTEKKRLTKKQILIIARSAAKSIYLYCHHAYYLTIDGRTTHQVTTAPTMKQAEEVISPFRTAIVRSRGPYFKMLTLGSVHNTTGSSINRAHLVSTKKGIEDLVTGSLFEVRPMTIDKLQGLNIHMASVDEWLSGDIREDVIGPLEQGCEKNKDSLLIAVSSEGTKRNGPGDDIKMELMNVLTGKYPNPHLSIWYYKLDDLSEVDNPKMWLKANPNLGKTVSYETYQLDKEKAEHVPSVRNDILAKRFGIPSQGYTYFFTYEETKVHRQREFWRMPCSLGVDLSRGDDFCAFTFLFPLPYEKFGVKVRSYISENTLMKLTPAMQKRYDDFIAEGTLMVMDGTILDMMQVYDDLDKFIIDSEYDVRSLGFDPYNAKDFIQRWEQENGPFGLEKVIQGAKTESVPLGEIKKLAEDRCLLFDEQLMSFCMENSVTQEDTNGNRKLLKKRHEEKIDNVSALMDAFVAYKVNRDMFD